jgi:hypothetical protein
MLPGPQTTTAMPPVLTLTGPTSSGSRTPSTPPLQQAPPVPAQHPPPHAGSVSASSPLPALLAQQAGAEVEGGSSRISSWSFEAVESVEGGEQQLLLLGSTCTSSKKSFSPFFSSSSLPPPSSSIPLAGPEAPQHSSSSLAQMPSPSMSPQRQTG